MGERCEVQGLPVYTEPPAVTIHSSVGLPNERKISHDGQPSQQPVQAKLRPSKALERSWRQALLFLTQDCHKGSASSPPAVLVLSPSGSSTVSCWLILNFVTGDTALFPEARPCQSTNSLLVNLKPEPCPTCTLTSRFKL